MKLEKLAEGLKQRHLRFEQLGGEDIKHVVWAGHVVRNTEGQSHYGAVGLTRTGYYRTAQVQVYGGGEEKWCWSPERHTGKYAAIEAAGGGQKVERKNDRWEPKFRM